MTTQIRQGVIPESNNIRAKLLSFFLDSTLVDQATKHPSFWKRVPMFVAKTNAAMLEEKNPEKKRKIWSQAKAKLFTSLTVLARDLPNIPVLDPRVKSKSHPKFGNLKRGRCKTTPITSKRLRILAALYYQKKLSLAEIKKICLLQKQNFTKAIRELNLFYYIYSKDGKIFQLTKKGKDRFLSEMVTSIQCVLQKSSSNTQCIVVPSELKPALEILEARQYVVKSLHKVGWKSMRIYEALEKHNVFYMKRIIENTVCNFDILNPGAYLYTVFMKNVTKCHRINECLKKNIADVPLQKKLFVMSYDEDLTIGQTIWLIRSIRQLSRWKKIWDCDIVSVIGYIRKIEAMRKVKPIE